MKQKKILALLFASSLFGIGKPAVLKNNRKLVCLTYRFTDLLAALPTVSIAAIRSFKTLSS